MEIFMGNYHRRQAHWYEHTGTILNIMILKKTSSYNLKSLSTSAFARIIFWHKAFFIGMGNRFRFSLLNLQWSGKLYKLFHLFFFCLTQLFYTEWYNFSKRYWEIMHFLGSFSCPQTPYPASKRVHGLVIGHFLSCGRT